MKRHPALQDFSREHQHTLSLAQQIIRAVQANKTEVMEELAGKVYAFYENELKKHFKQEEETFFKILIQEYPQYKSLAEGYLKEHSELLNMAIKLGCNPSSQLSKELETFALLLKSHTRKEERELFPMIEDCFTEQQLGVIKTGQLI